MKYVLEKAFISITKKVLRQLLSYTNIITNYTVDLIVFFLIAYFIFYNNHYYYNNSYYFLFLSGNQIVGEKISLGVFNNETDWSQEKIEKVRKGFLINSIVFIVLLHIR